MNKILKAGLLLQIPNAIILAILILSKGALVIQTISFSFDWELLIANSFWIVVGTAFALVNIFSIIFIIVGLTAKE